MLSLWIKRAHRKILLQFILPIHSAIALREYKTLTNNSLKSPQIRCFGSTQGHLRIIQSIPSKEQKRFGKLFKLLRKPKPVAKE
jgi:hypothetical protein